MFCPCICLTGKSKNIFLLLCAKVSTIATITRCRSLSFLIIQINSQRYSFSALLSTILVYTTFTNHPQILGFLFPQNKVPCFKFITISTIYIKSYKACPWSGFRQLTFVPFLSTFLTVHMELNEIQPYHLHFFMKSVLNVSKSLMWSTLILSLMFWILRTAQFQVLSYWSPV